LNLESLWPFVWTHFTSAEAWEVFDEAPGVLEALKKRGFLLALVSNWNTSLRRILKEQRLLPLFDAVAISSELGRRKPHPDIFRHVFETLRLPPEVFCHVGDRLDDDVQGAQSAACRAILLDRENRHKDFKGRRIRKLGELLSA
jgi:HAD superfamily hydrolase (TIGR01549 family)